MPDFPDWGSGGGGGGGGYASLTGAGQTTVPGDLQQTGGLAVLCTEPPGGVGFSVSDNTFNSGNPNGVPSVDIRAIRNPARIICGPNGASINPQLVVGGGDLQTISMVAQDFNQTLGHITIISTNLTMGIATGGGNATIRCTSSGAPGNFPSIGFFGANPVGLSGVTGSRGGNAALASVVTRLANLGLLIDNTTP